MNNKNAGNKSRKRVFLFIYSALAFVIIAALTFWSSSYTRTVLNSTELVHFFVPFPAGKVVRPMTVPNPNGNSVFTRPLAVDVQQQGLLKRVFNKWIVGGSTHWLVNTGNRPIRIGLKLTDTPIPIDWEVSAGIPWDPEKKVFGAPVQPGEMVPDLGIDWLFHIPENMRSQPVIYEGALTVFDADTSETLTVIPVSFKNGGAR